MLTSNDGELTSDPLTEIYKETAQQFFNAVRNITSPLGSSRIPQLDELIAQSHGESDPASPPTSLKRGDVIEIQGPAASGKTQLLYFFAVTCLLPHHIDFPVGETGETRKVLLGGRNTSVVVMDCDGRWDVLRLGNLIANHIRKQVRRGKTKVESEEIPSSAEHEREEEEEGDINMDEFDKELAPDILDSLVAKALSKLHIFRPNSSLSLAATLLALPHHHATHMADEDILMLFVDSISSFYWLDMEEDQGGIQPGAGFIPNVERDAATQPEELPPPPSAIQSILDALSSFISAHQPITILTNWALEPLGTSSTTHPRLYQQHLPAPYPAPFDEIPGLGVARTFPLTYHLTLVPHYVLPFPPDLSLEDALKDELRKEAVMRGQVSVIVRVPARAEPEVGQFVFDILEDEIAVH